jgi:flagellar basal-body rod protein FlgF
MTPGVYSIVSGLGARGKQQELLANNISGSNAVGHKREMTGLASFDTILRNVDNEAFAGRRLPTPLPYAQSTTFDFNNGEIKTTSQPLDAAILGDGFFQIQTNEGIRLSRNGHFTVDSQRRLINDGGMQIIGERGPITLPEGGEARIAQDGSILVNGNVADKLKIVRPKDLSALQTVNGGSIFSFENTQVEDMKTVMLVPGAVESSNVNISQEMVRMIDNQRMHEMLTKAMQTQDENIGRAIQSMSEI